MGWIANAVVVGIDFVSDWLRYTQGRAGPPHPLTRVAVPRQHRANRMIHIGGYLFSGALMQKMILEYWFVQATNTAIWLTGCRVGAWELGRMNERGINWLSICSQLPLQPTPNLHSLLSNTCRSDWLFCRLSSSPHSSSAAAAFIPSFLSYRTCLHAVQGQNMWCCMNGGKCAEMQFVP